MAWLWSLDGLLWIAAVVLFFAGFGIASLICGILGLLLALVLMGTSDWFSWYVVIDSLGDLFKFLD
jgi:hypothetical protein